MNMQRYQTMLPELLLLYFFLSPLAFAQAVWSPDSSNSLYRNPIIYADYSDPDVIRVGSDYYLTASSFVNTPGLPILQSPDLIHWRIVNHAVSNIPYGNFSTPQHGNGIWAPSLRYHDGEFYIFYGDPDYGIFMTKAKDPLGAWSEVRLVQKAKGWIDPCPLWDDDGNAYLVHAWARSRSGIKHRLTINRMSPDGTSLLDSGVTIYENPDKHPTLEGPKLYKRSGYYYILAPAGGVPTGWQVAFRSRNIYGPYDDKIVLRQGESPVNGPHQGGWVETPSGQSWFLHFQDVNAYGRIVHLQPVTWKNDWPEMGAAPAADAIGEPVLSYQKPAAPALQNGQVPQTSDEFDSAKLGLQWQWEANHEDNWYSLTAKPGSLRLFVLPLSSDTTRLYDLPNVLGQKFPAPQFTVTAKLDIAHLQAGGQRGLIINGMDYSGITISRGDSGFQVQRLSCFNAPQGGREIFSAPDPVASPVVFLRIVVQAGGLCTFSWSEDGNQFKRLGESFTAKKGVWVGARFAVNCSAPPRNQHGGSVDIDWIRVSRQSKWLGQALDAAERKA
jgi:beta-xylosidase